MQPISHVLRSIHTPGATCGILLALLSTLSGCASVMSDHPIGERVTDVGDLIDGAYLAGEEGIVHIKHIGEGELRLGIVEWQEDRFHLEELTAFVTRQDDVVYLNLVQPEESPEQRKYIFMRLNPINDEMLLVMFPRVETFRAAVSDKVLTGTTKDGDHVRSVHLQGSKEELEDFIDPDQVTRQFEFEEPVVLRRIGDGTL